MPQFVRRTWISIAALALLGAFVAGDADAFFHTDDGCPVEIHCLACQRALGSTGLTLPPLALRPVLVRAEPIDSPEPIAADKAESPSSPSRAPPLV